MEGKSYLFVRRSMLISGILHVSHMEKTGKERHSICIFTVFGGRVYFVLHTRGLKRMKAYMGVEASMLMPFVLSVLFFLL